MAVLHKAEVQLELYYPIALGLAATGACLKWGDQAFRFMLSKAWDTGAIFSSVFDVATVFTAFLFTFYSVFVTTERGFIGKAKGTLPYKRTVAYTLEAMKLGATLVLLSMPFLVVNPAPTKFGIELAVVAVWLGLAVTTAAAFFRASSIFAIFASQHI